MASNCVHCIRLLRSPTTIKQVSTQRRILANWFCTNARVPPDVLKSTASDFSGTKSSLFESEKVQSLLRKLTGLNLDKVFAPRKEELSNPVYKVLDESDLKKYEENTIKNAEKLLRMPPVMSRRKPINVILSEDKEIINHDENSSNYLFTDISMSKDQRTRAVFVRENDTGILREGTWDERDRMQFMYWPKDGQEREIVPMLHDEHLPRVFEQLRHKDVLDFINIQCEPDAPDYIRVHHRVYDDLDRRHQYDILSSTHHYGGMVFYYVTNRRTNNLLGYYIRQGRLTDAIDLVKLHSLIHADSALDALEDIHMLKEYLTGEGLHDLLNLLAEDKEAIGQ